MVNNLDVIKQQEITEEFFTKNIYDDKSLYGLFNKGFLKKIYINVFILKNDFEPKYFKFVNKRKDNFKHVFSRGGKPTYHIFEDCSTLVSSFTDYAVPFVDKNKELTEEEKILVKKYRNWFIKNDFRYKIETGNIKMDALVYRYNTSFALENNLKPLPYDYTFITQLSNSGYTQIESSFDLKKFKDEIDEIVYLSYVMGYDENLRKLRKLDWMCNLPKEELFLNLEQIFDSDFLENYGKGNIRDFMKRHYNLQYSAFKKILNYLKWNYGLKEKQFDKVKLEHFGFKLCSVCETTSIAI